MPTTPQYALSELCYLMSHTLESAMPDTYWVRAEISSISEKGGHAYLELIEKGQGETIFVAKIRATCWRNTYAYLKPYFQQQTQQELKTGIQILVEVSVSLHPVYGLSLVIHDIDPTFTLGEMALQRQATLRRLQADGVMELNSSLPFPRLPQRIAVISSADAAGYGDFCDQLQHNIYGFPFQITLFSAIMQGDRAAQSIIEAMERVAEQQDDFQVLLILRGGGATTDLTCFDDYELAFHCANFPLPIIAGIGHQRDKSVVDEVAFQSVKTPTAAAAFLIDRMVQALAQVEDLQRRLYATLDRRLLVTRHQLQQATLRFSSAVQRHISRQRDKLLLAEKMIALHSPEKIYRMGYSLTRYNGKIVHSASDIQAGVLLETEFADGKITSIAQ